MEGNWLSVFLLAAFVATVTCQLVCPRCTDKYDPDSCTETQTCGVEWNFCELIVHTGDYYSLEYVCQEHTSCTNHEIDGCHPETQETCSYCCEDDLTCKLQRDDLYTYVFPNIRPPTSSPAPTVPSVPTQPTTGPTYPCPTCSDPYDHETCMATQYCLSDSYDTCELKVHTNDDNRLEYSCQKYSDCTNHDVFGCHPLLNPVCSYCCLDPVACRLQRDDLFDYVFPPKPVTVAALPPAPAA